MKKIITLMAQLFVIFNIFSQINYINLEEVFRNAKMHPENLTQLQWRSEGEFIWVAKNSIINSSTKGNKIDTICRLFEINAKLKSKKIDTLNFFPSIKWVNEKVFYFVHKNKLLYFEIKKNILSVITEYYDKSANHDIDFQSKRVAYTRDDKNLFVSDNLKNFEVSKDGGNGIVNGESVHRNEWGIDKGTFWSPNGNYLAFYRMDESMVSEYPLIKTSEKISKVEKIRYPMAGGKSHEVTIGIYNVETGTSVFLQTGEPKEQFLTNITWSKDELSIFVAIVNRQQNNMKLNQYDVTTGLFIKTIYEETNRKYVEPQNGMFFFNKNPNKFLWLSQRDGWNHIYQFDKSGKMEKQYTKGEWVVKEIYGFDQKDEFLYFSGNRESVIETHIYSYEIKTGNILCLTKEPGTHSATFSKDFKYFIDRYNSTQTANTIKIKNNKGETIKTLLESKDPLKDYTLGQTQIFTIKNKNKQDLYCRLIKPANFDATKKYPCFVYVYGGPHSQLVTNSWLGGAGYFLNYMAQKGYVVFTLDNRGTANRGFEFESAIHRNLGTYEMEDQLCGIDYLKSQPYVDTTKMAIDGWSYGGFMTLTMILNNPNLFKSATCGGPVVDWKWYEVMYGERYMDMPSENWENYDKISTLAQIDNLKTRLLIFHGALDNTVVWQHSLNFIEKAIKAGKLVDYFVYPSHEHNVKGIDRLHLWRKIEQYHNDILK